MTDVFRHFHNVVTFEIGELVRDGALPAGLDLTRVTVEPPRDPSHGDVAANAAMVLAKTAGMAPKAFAEKLAARLRKTSSLESADRRTRLRWRAMPLIPFGWSNAGWNNMDLKPRGKFAFTIRWCQAPPFAFTAM